MIFRKWIKERQDWVDAASTKLLQEFPLGSEFDYLGRTCIVKSHGWGSADTGWVPELGCRYADMYGVIRDVSFTMSECDSLIEKRRARL